MGNFRPVDSSKSPWCVAYGLYEIVLLVDMREKNVKVVRVVVNSH